MEVALRQWKRRKIIINCSSLAAISSSHNRIWFVGPNRWIQGEPESKFFPIPSFNFDRLHICLHVNCLVCIIKMSFVWKYLNSMICAGNSIIGVEALQPRVWFGWKCILKNRFAFDLREVFFLINAISPRRKHTLLKIMEFFSVSRVA